MKEKYIRTNLLRVIFFALPCFLGLMSSCKKLVDAGSPLTTITTDQTFSRDGSANAAIAGLYSLMMNGNNDLIFSNGALTVYAGMSSDELTNYAGVGDLADYNFSINKLDSQNPVIQSSFWKPQYKLVFNANSILEGIAASTSNQLTPGVRKQLTAEAKFIRAFSYFYLVNLFGDVPLVLSTDWKANTQLKRAPKEEIYLQMVKDLKEAQSDLPEDYALTGGQRIRANKFAATALLARVYLYTKDWKNAEAEASKVIANSQFALEEDLNNVFLSTSRESIWQLKASLSSIGNTSRLYDYVNFKSQQLWSEIPDDLKPLYLDQSIFPDVNFLFYGRYTMTSKLSAAFENDDKRLVIWTNYVDTPTYPPYTGITDHVPSKYTRIPGMENGQGYYTVLRFAEQLLIRAEARANLSNIIGADEDLNKIRNRAGLVNLTSGSVASALQAVAHERQTELFAEWGHRWFDLKRTGKVTEAFLDLPTKRADANQLLYPIPDAEIKVDPNLIQNPGY